MADYRDYYSEIRAASANVAAVSVDAPEKSEALRVQLRLPFPILCDTERRLVKEWDLYNPREKGGIAKPSVFIIEPARVVRYAAVDKVATRVPATEIVRVLEASGEVPVRRKVYIPVMSDWLNAIRNLMRR